MLYLNSDTPQQWGHGSLDAASLPLEARPTQITAFELLAPLWALQNLNDVRSAQLDLYIDNSSAEHILRKGSSGSLDPNDFAEQFWTLASTRNLSVRVFRVASKLNVADAASRFALDSVPPLGCTQLCDQCSALTLEKPSSGLVASLA